MEANVFSAGDKMRLCLSFVQKLNAIEKVDGENEHRTEIVNNGE